MARTVRLAAWCLDASHESVAALGHPELVGPLCYSCHAPGAARDRRFPYDERDAREGVGCEACHSIASVRVTARLDPSEIRREVGIEHGPREDVDAPHAVRASPLLRRSEICAACHYFAWPGNGMPIEWTYPQWRASPQAAAGVTCQDCHMPRRRGRASERRGAPIRADVASHAFHGSRDPAMLRRALRLELRARPRRGGWRVLARVSNVGAGHSVPGGGGGLRRLELRLQARDAHGAGRWKARRRYRRLYLRRDGRPTSGTSRDAVRTVDTAIRAGERRLERFSLPALGAPRELRAQLRFWYVAPDVQRRDGLALDRTVAGPVKIVERRLRLADAPLSRLDRRRPTAPPGS